jgi:hypothetical protein
MQFQQALAWLQLNFALISPVSLGRRRTVTLGDTAPSA